MEEKIVTILNEMAEYLTVSQMKKLQEVILRTFSENELEKQQISNEEFLKMFLDAKRVEGCSERTIQYYKVTAEHMLSQTEKEIRKITTDEMRSYLADYQKGITARMLQLIIYDGIYRAFLHGWRRKITF